MPDQLSSLPPPEHNMSLGGSTQYLNGTENRHFGATEAGYFLFKGS